METVSFEQLPSLAGYGRYFGKLDQPIVQVSCHCRRRRNNQVPEQRRKSRSEDIAEALLQAGLASFAV